MCFRYSEAVSVLYKSNVFDCMYPCTIQDLHASILPDRWMSIQSLYVSWTFAGFVNVTEGGSLYFSIHKGGWESACRAIKTLRDLRHFTLVLSTCCRRYDPEAMRNLLEPLKDLCLKRPWELMICGSQDDLHAVDTVLKMAGFDCLVTSLKVHNHNCEHWH